MISGQNSELFQQNLGLISETHIKIFPLSDGRQQFVPLTKGWQAVFASQELSCYSSRGRVKGFM